ncbi:MAG: hypothetical protein PHX74_06555, partial [Candidatus Sumerlaeales bacterium]|nr:hypothetical protein [Candidatus Sumerlaeales bacterium]
MAIKATGSKTIIDLSDGKSLSVFLGANQPRTQIYDVNATTYVPDWTTVPGKLLVTPVIYANQTAIALDNVALSITWKRKEGSGAEAVLATGETVSANVLTVQQNKMSSVTSGLLTYIAYVTYTDPDTALPINAVADISFSLLRTGENAKSAWISGEQVFKYAVSGGAASPAQITLSANLQSVTMSKWQYRDATLAWVDYPTTGDNANITSVTLNVKLTHAIWVGESATIRILTSDANIGDTTSIYKVTDGTAGGTGSPGQNASIVFLSNENVTFAGNAAGQVAKITPVCNVVAYTGTTKVTPTVGTVSGAVTGMTVTKGSAVSNEIPISIAIAANATLGGAGAQAGTLTVPITSPVSTTLYIRWSKVNTGAAGVNAVVFSLYAPGGTVFVNGSGTLSIQSVGYDGSTLISSGATYLWEKYTTGSWTTVSGQTASSLSVDGATVVGMASYRCTMTYATKTYKDTITLIDKTDNYQAEIDSTSGDIFKNTVGTTCLICRLWQNGTEVDPLKATTYSTTAPASPATGTFYYKIVTTTPVTALMRWSGSAWVDVTIDATY